MPEPVTAEKIHLPKITARLRRCVTVIALQIPVALRTGKKTGGMIEQDEKVELVEGGGVFNVVGAGN